MTPILGAPQATKAQAHRWAAARATRAVWTPAIIATLVHLYWQIGTEENVRPDVALAQSAKETGFWSFTGDVAADQWNLAGIGAVGGGVPGERWDSLEAGVRGHLRRLRMYADGSWEIYDLAILKRSLGTRYWSSARFVEDFGSGRWAPSPSYGRSIVDDYLASLLATDPGYSDITGHWAETPIRRLIDLGLMEGDGHLFRPDAPATRAELAVVVDRLVDLLDPPT